MEKEKAICILQAVKAGTADVFIRKAAIKDALDMAISALEKQEAIKSCTPPSDDWEHYADRLHDISYQSGYEQGKRDAEQDRWIPVTERLPEKDCSCRITEGDFKSVFDCCWNNHKKRFEIWSDYNDCYLPLVGVTAWKSIEEPYTEEES